MGGFVDRPLALLVLLMMGFAASPTSAQTVQQTTSTGVANVTLANADASALDLRLARPLSRREEAALRPRDRFRECDHCPEMVIVPGGSFTMGASQSEFGSTADERPQHVVTVQRFGVGRSPVSVDQWNACVRANGCSHRLAQEAEHDGDPVTGILWDEANEYVQWLSRATGRSYRMLSEAEREYATRAGSTTAFWWGDGADPHLADAASVADLIADIGITTVAMTTATPPLANPFGLLDVHGGVYDWVADCRHDNYVGAPADGSAWITGDCEGHVLRGGASTRALQTRRSAARLWFGPPNRMSYMSVRVARTLRP
jgi:formylglycine-generating enzyme required for sulfatase activity